jgi:citrate synthase
MPTMIAAWGRIREGKEPIGPRDDLSIAGNFLYMLDGKDPIRWPCGPSTAPDPADRARHERQHLHRPRGDQHRWRHVLGHRGGDWLPQGPKHGGANEQAMRLFFEVEDSGLGVEEWYKQARAAGRRFAGIGHRIYKAFDPRAGILRDDARALAQTSGNTLWFDIAYKIEELTRADAYFVERNLYPNVDYYSAIVLYTLGIPTDMFTPLFALSRIAGWTAHIIEQWEDNRLIRPESEYIGPMGLSVIPIEQRG